MLAWTWGVCIHFRVTWARLTLEVGSLLGNPEDFSASLYANAFALVLHKYSMVLNCAV